MTPSAENTTTLDKTLFYEYTRLYYHHAVGMAMRLYLVFTVIYLVGILLRWALGALLNWGWEAAVLGLLGIGWLALGLMWRPLAARNLQQAQAAWGAPTAQVRYRFYPEQYEISAGGGLRVYDYGTMEWWAQGRHGLFFVSDGRAVLMSLAGFPAGQAAVLAAFLQGLYQEQQAQQAAQKKAAKAAGGRVHTTAGSPATGEDTNQKSDASQD